MLRVFAFRGYFIAAYAQPVGSDRYVGYAHICTERPKDIKSIQSLERVQSVGIYDTEEKATHAADFQARLDRLRKSGIYSSGPNLTETFLTCDACGRVTREPATACKHCGLSLIEGVSK